MNDIIDRVEAEYIAASKELATHAAAFIRTQIPRYSRPDLHAVVDRYMMAQDAYLELLRTAVAEVESETDYNDDRPSDT